MAKPISYHIVENAAGRRLPSASASMKESSPPTTSCAEVDFGILTAGGLDSESIEQTCGSAQEKVRRNELRGEETWSNRNAHVLEMKKEKGNLLIKTRVSPVMGELSDWPCRETSLD